jgi:hypothetical protein
VHLFHVTVPVTGVLGQRPSSAGSSMSSVATGPKESNGAKSGHELNQRGHLGKVEVAFLPIFGKLTWALRLSGGRIGEGARGLQNQADCHYLVLDLEGAGGSGSPCRRGHLVPRR